MNFNIVFRLEQLPNRRVQNPVPAVWPARFHLPQDDCVEAVVRTGIWIRAQKIFSVNRLFEARPDRIVEFGIGDDSLNSRLLRTELGWSPRFTDFRSGLEATVAWYREHEDWWRPAKARVEAAYAVTGQA